MKNPLEWKLNPPASPYRGLAAAFSAAWDAGVFTGRLNEKMSAEEYLSLVTPYLPEQSNHRAKIALADAQSALTLKEKNMRKNSATLTDEDRAWQALAREEKKVSQLTSTEEAAKLVISMLREHALDIKGMMPYARERLVKEPDGEQVTIHWSVEWSRAFSVGCTLYVRFVSADFVRGTKYLMNTYTPQIEVNWSGTGRSVAASLAAIELYKEVTALAALIEARLAEVHSIGTASLLTEG
jgi:hypothetical protein